MPEPTPTAIVVVLREGTSDTDASILRSWLRLLPQVADIRPVTSNNAQVVAESRVRAAVADTLTPIFDELRLSTLAAIEAATDSFQAVVETPQVDPPPAVTSLPQRRR